MNKLDPKVLQGCKDKACKMIQECDEIELDTDFGLSDGISTKNGYRAYEYGDRVDIFKIITYRQAKI